MHFLQYDEEDSGLTFNMRTSRFRGEDAHREIALSAENFRNIASPPAFKRHYSAFFAARNIMSARSMRHHWHGFDFARRR